MKKNILLFLALFLMTAIGARADGNELEITKVNETTWEFTMPDKAIDLQLTFTDGSTAVVSVNNGEVKKVEWYDISGRKLPSEPKKTGVYIKNGKVVIVKK